MTGIRSLQLSISRLFLLFVFWVHAHVTDLMIVLAYTLCPQTHNQSLTVLSHNVVLKIGIQNDTVVESDEISIQLK